MAKLRYWKDKFAMRGAFGQPAKPFEAHAADGVRIFGVELESQGDGAFLVVHGFLANHRAPGILDLAESLTRYGRVWSIDLRGHGLSAGECTLGNLEALDVAAAVAEIRRRTDRPLTLIGFSMGGAAVVRAVALYQPAEAIVAVSSPAEWSGSRRWAARRTRLIHRTPGGLTVLRALTGVRVQKSWRTSESPASVIGEISPAPVLLVHGTGDRFFPAREAERLFDAARGPKDLWMIEEGGHAEGLFTSPGLPPNRIRVDRFADEMLGRLAELNPR